MGGYGGRMSEIPTPDDHDHPGQRSEGLYRSRRDRILLGVCGGIAEYYDMDPVLVRILMFLVTLTVIGILGYIILGIIIPDDPWDTTSSVN
jgi:phage shock protein C